MRTLVVIPARSGSKGLKDKNIKLLNGKPLIHYSIEIAQKVFNNKDICFSTDSTKYANIAKETGIEVPFLRPKELSSDVATSQEVLLHALKFYKKKGFIYEAVMLLQVTSPFRKEIHIKEVLREYNKEIDMIVSVKETESNPYYVLVEENDKGYLEKSKKGCFVRRQDCPKVYEYNGSIYLINVKSLESKLISEFNKVKKYEMGAQHSIDIDSKLDFDLASFLLNKRIV